MRRGKKVVTEKEKREIRYRALTSSCAGGSGWNVTVYVPTSIGGFADFPWNLSARKAVSNGIVPYLFYHDNFAENFPGTPTEDFALTATINIAVAAGNYQFCTTSSDGSWLYVDGSLAVKNQGLHAPMTVCQSNYLYYTGIHTIRVNYFKHAGSSTTLEVSMDGSFTISNGKAP